MDLKTLLNKGKTLVDAGQKLWNNGGQTVYTQIRKKNKISDFSLNEFLDMGQEALDAIQSIKSEGIALQDDASSDGDISENMPAEVQFSDEMSSDIEISENMSEEEEEAYLANLSTSLSAPGDIKAAIVTLCDKTLDTIKFCEAQETKRTGIIERANVQIEQIRAQKEFLMSYLEKTFDERHSIFSKEFEVLDKALETGNTAIMAQCLNSITALAQSSPFKALTDADFSSLQSGEMLLDI